MRQGSKLIRNRVELRQRERHTEIKRLTQKKKSLFTVGLKLAYLYTKAGYCTPSPSLRCAEAEVSVPVVQLITRAAGRERVGGSSGPGRVWSALSVHNAAVNEYY